jgi:hypothetical protein
MMLNIMAKHMHAHVDVQGSGLVRRMKGAHCNGLIELSPLTSVETSAETTGATLYPHRCTRSSFPPGPRESELGLLLSQFACE